MRKIVGAYDAPHPHWVGNGFSVRSIISPQTHGTRLSPFILLDYMGPTIFEPAAIARGVSEHPHRGFETVTIVYQGEVEHRDSTGSGGLIGPGDVQWMTAASGILHAEFHSKAFTAKGGTMEMVQLWINLPAKNKKAAPGYQTLLNKDIPSVELADGAGEVRVIAGEFYGQKGPARTFTPINIWDVHLRAGRSVSLTLPKGHTLAVIVLTGTIEVNGMQFAHEAQIVVFDYEGGEIALSANNDVKFLVLSGEPIDEPVVAHGPFVMNTVDEIQIALLDFESGRF